MDVIGKLNKLRLERNMSVYRLAELTGINQSTLANTFSRGTIPSIQNLEIICSVLGISLSQFFSTDEEKITMTIEDKLFFDNFKKLPNTVQINIKQTVNSIVEAINNE